MYFKNKDQIEIVEWLEGKKINQSKVNIENLKSRFEYMVTLTFNFPRNFTSYSRDKVIKIITSFKNRLRKRIFYKRTSHKYPFVSFIEDRTVTNRPEQIHTHLLITPPAHVSSDKFKVYVEDAWKIPNIFCGKTDIKKTDNIGATIYSSKLLHQWNTDCLDVKNLCLMKNYLPAKFV